eukprot:scaffold3166_cov399-Prasinococcus_capsulatus_cf.AAC.17
MIGELISALTGASSSASAKRLADEGFLKTIADRLGMAEQPAKRQKTDPEDLEWARRFFAENEQKTDPEKWITGANEAITFKLVKSKEQFLRGEDCGQFKPAFTHQTFGEEEVIGGYRGLHITIWLHASTLAAFIESSFTDEVGRFSSHKKDDYIAKLVEDFPGGLETDKAKFVETLDGASARWLADLGTSVSIPKQGYKLIHIPREPLNGESELSKDRLACYQRAQSLVFFFIDGASQIQLDSKWEQLVLVKEEGENIVFCGFTTLYNFYCYPESTRVRLSQILVLPPFQRQGFAYDILSHVHTLVLQRSSLDLSVEEASDAFARVRDLHDLRILLADEGFAAAAKACSAGFAGDELSLCFPPLEPRLRNRIHREHKLCRRQIQHCWQLAVSYFLDVESSSQLEKLRKAIKCEVQKEFGGADKKAIQKKGRQGEKRVVDGKPADRNQTEDDGEEEGICDFVMLRFTNLPDGSKTEEEVDASEAVRSRP